MDVINSLNHVAFLVESIEKTVVHLGIDHGLLQDIENFPSEGTNELYIGPGNSLGKLLLMEATGPGPYQEAIKKRGTGLHHIAIDTINLLNFTKQLAGTGWYLHPSSLTLYKDSQCVFLARPGTPVLIEVQQRSKSPTGNYFIHQLEFPFKNKTMCSALCTNRILFGKELKLLDSHGNQMFSKICT